MEGDAPLVGCNSRRHATVQCGPCDSIRVIMYSMRSIVPDGRPARNQNNG